MPEILQPKETGTETPENIVSGFRAIMRIPENKEVLDGVVLSASGCGYTVELPDGRVGLLSSHGFDFGYIPSIGDELEVSIVSEEDGEIILV